MFNAIIERRPTAILKCSRAEDVAHGVTAARVCGLPISIKGGGHSVAGNAVCERGLMLDMSSMKRISADPERDMAVAEAGLTLGEFDAATSRYGLATTLGVGLHDRHRRPHSRGRNWMAERKARPGL